jgi:DedD protein
MQQNEQELSLKKRARRRLVGALALVLLMVIFLPMLLKNPAAPTASDEDVRITLTQESATETASEEFASESLPAKPIIETAPVETPVVAEKKQPEDLKIVAKSEPKTSEASESTTNNASVQKFYVQIGVFSEMPNVKQLQSKLTDLGYSSSTEKINTDKGAKIRLRTKTFDNRNEAAIALENIKDAGLTGMVVSQ